MKKKKNRNEFKVGDRVFVQARKLGLHNCGKSFTGIISKVPVCFGKHYGGMDSFNYLYSIKPDIKGEDNHYAVEPKNVRLDKQYYRNERLNKLLNK